MPKISLVNFDFSDNAYEQQRLEEAGIEMLICESPEPEDIIRELQGVDGAITSYGNFTPEVFESLPNLKVVSRTGVGYDQINVDAATKAGCAVCTFPGYGTEVVSDHAITLAMSALRRINELDADLRAGVWDYARTRPLGQAQGRIFGIVGMGDIGKAAARKAAGLGFKVVCWSRSLTPGTTTEEAWSVLELDELMQTADVISLHTALTPETQHLIDERRIALMKEDAILVNTSRGAVVDTIALAKALEAGKLWGAGLDVFEEEPIDASHPIMGAPHTVLSAHAAYYSEESAAELRRRATQAAIDVVLGNKPADCLNPEVLG